MRTAPVLCLILLALIGPPIDGAVSNVEIVTPRAFGYVIGDVIRHKIRIELDNGYRMQLDSLPEAGRLNRWLELRSLSWSNNKDGGANAYEIELIYQILNSPERLQEVFIPNFTLTATDGEQTLPVLIPEWGFTIAPITRIGGTTTAAFLDIKPERPPPAIPITPYVIGLVIMGVVILLVLLFLAYAYASIPFFQRANGPFALAYRQLKRLHIEQVGPTRYRAALRCVHHALNQTAGAVLFPDGLNTFFSHHPRYMAERAAIEKLFAQSRAAFYDSWNNEDAQTHSIDWLLRLCRRCRDLERGLA